MIGFKAESHPQQVATGTANPDKDERYTPLSFFKPLHDALGFTVDAAGCVAAPVSLFIGRWWDIEKDGLAQDWSGEIVWNNPPYSNLWPWLEKAASASTPVVQLLPANRCDQPWWQHWVEPVRDREDGRLRTLFTPSRGRFGTPESPSDAKWFSSAPFGCVLLFWRCRPVVPGPWKMTR